MKGIEGCILVESGNFNMVKYQSFREQTIKCERNGNSFIENCFICGEKLIMCKKYGGQCISSKCKLERTTNS